MEHTDENGIIVPFRQNAEFYYRCACRYIEEDNLLLATQYARKAYQMEPSDLEYAITLAETLNRIHRYEESIAILLLSGSFAQLPSDALFGLASDFMGMEEFGAAQQCAELCIQSEPDGPYAERAEELLDLLEDHEDLEIQIGLEEGEDCKMLEGIRIAKAMHLSGNSEEALRNLNGMLKQYPASDILDLEIATLLFSLRSYEEAERRVFNVFKRNSHHIRAHLLLALLYRAEGREDEAKEELRRTIVDPDASPEELGYAGAVFIEFDQISRAVDSLERLREYLPFDKDMLHQLGYCYSKQGEQKKAEDVYRILLQSDESDTVAAYYEQAIRTESPETFQKAWSMHYEVPTKEYLRRREQIQTVAENGEDAIRSAWENDPSFRDLLKWALFSQIVPFRKAVIRMLSLIHTEETEKLLRRFLISYDQGDGEKQFVFGTLLSMEAEPPFALYMGGTWQYGSVHPLNVPEHLPRSYAYILWAIQQLRDRAEAVSGQEASLVSDRMIEVAVRIFLLYTNSLEGYFPKLSHPQEDAMAAAFVLLALGSLDNTQVTPQMLCTWYDVSRRRLENALQRVFRQLQREKDE
ncbi:MAG: tetratricopeptide repeat protein [Clostridia bacterium]|nr:tetratricopeptide repeat protein [Clostridia bacterium]